MADLARILIYGDPHLHSKNYGAHINYPKESLDCYKKITQAIIDNKATHLISLGDMTYGRFHTLEYRTSVEEELTKQYGLVNGNHYSLKGNHDSAGYGMTEYEYYITKGLIKPSCNMTIGNVHITMVDYGMEDKTSPNIGDPSNSINILLAHNFLKFKDSLMPNFGKAIELDNYERWYGVDYIVCGHIHTQHALEGLIVKDIDGQPHGHRVMVQYPGSLVRPMYREGMMDETGALVLLEIKDTGEMGYNSLDVELPPLEEVFNLAMKEEQASKKEAKENRVDISDIIQQLNSHERNVGNPEDIIATMEGIDERYKNKAIELLKLGQG